MIDEKQHTDVVEKIIEMSAEEDLQYRNYVTNDSQTITNRERNLMQEDLNEKYVKTVDHVDFVRNENIYVDDLVKKVMID